MIENTNKPKRTGFGHASTSSILKTFAWHKEKTLPDPVNAKVLYEKGIPERDMFTVPRTLQDYGLIDSDAHPTKTFDLLASAYQTNLDEYQEVLRTILRNTYSEIFDLIDPSKATSSQFRAAFEKYEPRGERPKMISLYRGMCREAGLMPRLESITRDENGRFKATSEAETGSSDISQYSTPLQVENAKVESIGEKKMNGHISLDQDQFVSDGIYKTLQYLRQLRLGNHSGWTDRERKELDEMIEHNFNLLREAFKRENS